MTQTTIYVHYIDITCAQAKTVFFFLLLHIYIYLINKLLLSFFQDAVIFKYNTITLQYISNGDSK